MNYWIFKISDQDQYPDQHFQTYAFDSRHSKLVQDGDSFVYLDKRRGRYGFIGHGDIAKVFGKGENQPKFAQETDYVATLENCVEYSQPLSIKRSTIEGRRNRTKLGLFDLNAIGWSRSIVRLDHPMFERVVDLAYGLRCVTVDLPTEEDYTVPDAWSTVRRRHNTERFKNAVLERQHYTCTICGTTLREALDVAHVSSYAADIENRANPANGIVLCAFCHRAFDGGVFRILEDGNVITAPNVHIDDVTDTHLKNLTAKDRLKLLDGVDKELLRLRN